MNTFVEIIYDQMNSSLNGKAKNVNKEASEQAYNFYKFYYIVHMRKI